MDNQLAITEIDVLMKRAAITTLALMVLILGWIFVLPKLQVFDPYVENVLSLKGDFARGQAIFFYNCAGCHAGQTDAIFKRMISNSDNAIGDIHTG